MPNKNASVPLILNSVYVLPVIFHLNSRRLLMSAIISSCFRSIRLNMFSFVHVCCSTYTPLAKQGTSASPFPFAN